MAPTSLDVLIVNFNTAHLLEPMFQALRGAAEGIPVRYLVVDNASTDNSAEVLRERCPEAVLTFNYQNIGFGRANNQLLARLRSPYVLLLNTDAFVSPNSLSAPLAFMESHPECGLLGVRLVGRDGALQPSCRYFPTPINVFLSRTGLGRLFPWVRQVDDMAWDHRSARECDWVPGCYYLMRREVIDQVGLFDPRFFLYYEEVDHCKRVKAAGWKVMYFPDTSVIHIGGESAKSAGNIDQVGRQISPLQMESEMLYFRKHHGRLGLALHMLLTGMGDAILAAKAAIRKRRGESPASFWEHLRLAWRLLRCTRLATEPTR